MFVEFETDEIEQSIVARFVRQVERHGDRLAVKSAGRPLTYAELDRAANRVARDILEDTRAGLVVTGREHRGLAGTLARPERWLDIDDVDAGSAAEPPPLATRPDDLAHIL
jgi:hypothetical protein